MKTEKEKMLAGETYFAYDPELMELHRQALRLVKEYNAICFDDYKRIPDYCNDCCHMLSLLW